MECTNETHEGVDCNCMKELDETSELQYKQIKMEDSIKEIQYDIDNIGDYVKSLRLKFEAHKLMYAELIDEIKKQK